MAGWAELEAAAPELAGKGRELIDLFRFVYIATLRRDGTPRISAVEARIAGGELAMSMIPGTLKARDLLRDPRLALNAPLQHPDDPNEEFKLRGRAVEVHDRDLKEAVAAAVESTSGWRPPPGWDFFSVDIGDAAFIAWNAGVMRMLRWSPEEGVQEVERPVAVL
jgi:Pyridoxamine 5'-phosphate oxidase